MHLTLVLFLAAAPSMAIMTFEVSDLPSARGDFYTEHFSTRLMGHGLKVTTPKDMASVLGLERQRQLLGCSEMGSCLAELAGALGVDEVATGQVVKVDAALQLVVKVIRTSDARVRFARSATVKNETELLSTLDAWALEVAGKSNPPSPAPFILGGIGAAGLLVGAFFAVDSASALGQLNQRPVTLSLGDALQVRERGQRNQLVAGVSLGLGAAALLGGLVWALLSRGTNSPLAFVPSSAGVAVVGVWP
jgi:hypothetical protein